MDVPKVALAISVSEIRMFHFAEIVSRVRSGEVSLEGVEAMVINGQLSSQDVDLLVEDGLVGQEDATKLLEDSQEEIDEAFTQANTFATLVVDGKVSHDELQVMRVKGVLGNSVIHFLVKEVRHRSTHHGDIPFWCSLRLKCAEQEFSWLDDCIGDYCHSCLSGSNLT